MSQNWEERWQYTQTKMDVYAKCREDVFRLRELMIKVLNMYLENQTEDNYQLFYKIFMENYNHMIFETMVEMKRIRRIVEILEMERTNHMKLFADGAANADALMEKYVLTIFALRRIELEPTKEMTEEAKLFLLDNYISPIAIVQIVGDELFLDAKKIFQTMETLYKDHAMDSEKVWMSAILREMQK